MKRETLDIAGLRPLALLNGVEFCDGRVTIEHSSERNRSGLVVTEDIDETNAILVRVPSDLVLSLEVGDMVSSMELRTSFFLVYCVSRPNSSLQCLPPFL